MYYKQDGHIGIYIETRGRKNIKGYILHRVSKVLTFTNVRLVPNCWKYLDHPLAKKKFNKLDCIFKDNYFKDQLLYIDSQVYPDIL